MFKVNGYEVEYNFLDVESREYFEEEFLKTSDIVEKSVKGVDEKSAATLMRECCEAVWTFIDNLFGEGTADAMFEGKLLYDKCLLAIADITLEAKRQDEEISKISKEIAGKILGEDIKNSTSNKNKATRRKMNKLS